MFKDSDFTTKQWQYGVIELEKHQFDAGQLDNDEGCEDVTDALFSCCDELKEGEHISREDFDLADTMNGFELMDVKMDNKSIINDCFSPQKSKAEGILKDSWTNTEILAILNH